MLSDVQIRDYCLQKAGTSEDFPFGPDARVFKVLGKMFALIPTDTATINVNLKCEPQLAEILRETYEAVIPGYHMNKKHWNTVTVDGTIPDDEILEMIDNSYQLVVKGLTKTDREKLSQMEGKP